MQSNYIALAKFPPVLVDEFLLIHTTDFYILISISASKLRKNSDLPRGFIKIYYFGVSAKNRL